MKTITAAFVLPLFFLSVSTQLKAQENEYAVAVAHTYSSNSNSNNVPDNLRGLNTTVYNDLTKKFSNISDAHWSTKDQYTFIYLKENNQPVRVAYSKKGKWVYTIRYFDASNAPEKYTDILRRNGYSQNISSISTIERRYGTTAYIKLKYKNSIQTVQVYANGEVEEVK